MDDVPLSRVEVIAENPGWMVALPGITRLIEKAALAVLAAEEKTGEVAILLSDDRHVRKLNLQFRGTDAATNVLSFPADSAGRAKSAPPGELQPLGDIILAIETLQREAGEQAKTLEAHISHLVVHGMLHILGYDHQNDTEWNIMTQRESDILAGLRRHG